jgi:hypothetical protein
MTTTDGETLRFHDNDNAGEREVLVERDGANLISLTVRCEWPDRFSGAKVSISLEDQEVDSLIAHLSVLRAKKAIEAEQKDEEG